MSKQKGQVEEKYYKVVQNKIAERFEVRFDYYFEITANKEFSEALKSKISPGRNIIFSFLRKVRPDITGTVKKKDSNLWDFVVIEIKKGKIELANIYQTRKYADLLNAKFTFLVSLRPIPTEIKQLHTIVPTLLTFPTIYQNFALVFYNEKINEFEEFFPENPFEKSYLMT